MKKLITLFLLSLTFTYAQDNAKASLDKLMEGNNRFAAHQLTHLNTSAERIKELTESQHPFAVILSCSDSRVPPEIIFDQGLGDIFVVRDAGNVADEVTLASIEYAAAKLNTPLILVLGHEHCGAVHAAIEGGDLGKNLNFLIDKIKPAVNAAEKEKGDKMENAVEENVKLSVKSLTEESQILKNLVAQGKLKIAAGVYNLETGRVELLGE